MILNMSPLCTVSGLENLLNLSVLLEPPSSNPLCAGQGRHLDERARESVDPQ